MLRVEEYLERYINGVSYEQCLIPDEETASLLSTIKEKNDFFNLEQARYNAEMAIKHIEALCEYALSKYPEGHNPKVDELLNEVQYKIMKSAIATELMEEKVLC